MPEDQLPFASRTTATATATPGTPVALPSTTVSSEIVVYVAGAVTRPGVYALHGAARVTDALEAAGGAGADADLDVVNLAAAVRDGERIYVPVVGEVIPVVVAGDSARPTPRCL